MRSDPVPALVLAAGRSTRIARTLDGRSKVLIEIGGLTVLERNLRWLADSGVTSVWINLHYRPDDVKAAVGNGHRFGVTVQYSEEPELMGTAGAFRVLAPHWTGTTLVVYGDNVSSFDLSQLLARHRRSGGIATIALYNSLTNANSGIFGGTVMVDAGRVVRFVEGPETGAFSPLVNTGVYALEPGVLDYVPEGRASDFGRDVFPALLAAGKPVIAHVIEPEGYCFGIDTAESLARTRQALDAARNASR